MWQYTHQKALYTYLIKFKYKLAWINNLANFLDANQYCYNKNIVLLI